MKIKLVDVLKFLVLSLLTLSTIAVPAQQGEETRFEIINNTTGLNSDYISGIVSDDRGFMWFATIEGLCRYDGVKIKKYSTFLSDGSISYTKEIRSLKYHDKLLWIGSIDGIVTFDPLTEVFTPIDVDGMQSQEVTVMEFDRRGDLWIGTQQGLYLYSVEQKQLEAIDVKQHAPHSKSNNIKSLYCDSQNNMWIGYWYAGLTKYDRASDTFDRVEIEDPRSSVLSIFEDSSGDLYIGTWRGAIVKIKCGETKGVTVIENLSQEFTGRRIDTLPLFFIHKDAKSGNYWVGSNNGIYVLSSLDTPELIEHITVNSQNRSVSNNTVSLCMYDAERDILWLGSRGGGVNLLRLTPSYITSNNIAEITKEFGSGFVKAIYDDGQRVWLSVRNAGLFVGEKSGDQAPNFRYDNRGSSNINTMLKLRSRDEVWLGNQSSGITIIDPESNLVKTNYIQGDSIISKHNVVSLYEDIDGAVWIGCNRGLLYARSSGDKWYVEEIEYADNIKHRIVGITQCRDGYIWAATRHNGVYKILYDNGKLVTQHYDLTIDNDTPFNNIITIYCDSSNNLWLGVSSLGLIKYDVANDRFHYENSIVGKNLGTVNSIIEYSKGELWIGTMQGVYYYNFTNAETPYLKHYTHLDGLIENITVGSSISRGSNGDIHIGANSGYSTISPEIHQATINYNLTVTDIAVNYQSILYPNLEYSDAIDRDSSGNISRLDLHHLDNNLTLSLSTLALSPNSNIRYQYMMEGIDDNWNEVVNHKKEINYQDLGWGKYRFRAKIIDTEAIADSGEIIIDVTISPPFYASWWAIILYISIFGFIAYDMINSRRIKRRLSTRIQVNCSSDTSESISEQTNVTLIPPTPEPKIEDNMNRDKEEEEKEEYREIASPKIQYKDINEQYLSKAIAVVNDNLDNSDFELSDFIEAMHTTKSMLYRKLKSMTSMSPNEFIRHIRLKVSHTLITEKYETITISEVAYAVGFNDPKHFTKCFKKQYGMTPSQFRDSLIEKKD